MARLIDVEPIVKFIKDGLNNPNKEEAFGYTAVQILTEIEYAPIVDAVEVVRCKDCKHWLKDVAGCTESIGRCEFANYFVGAAGFCTYGERRDDG